MAKNTKIKGVTIQLSADTTQVSKKLETLEKSIGGTTRSLKDVSRLLKLDPGNTELLAQKQALLGDAIDDTKKKLEAQKDALRDIDAQASSGKDMTDQQMALRRAVEETTIKLRDLETQAAASADTLANKMKAAGEELESAGGKIESAGKKMQGIGTGVAKAGAVLTAGVTVPLVAAGRASIENAMSLEDAMAKLRTLDGVDAIFEQMRDDILRLSDETGIAATTIASNVYDAISAGQQAGDAVSFTETALRLSKAGFAEQADALDILTTVLNSYGLASEEAGAIASKLITTQNLGKTTVGDLAAGLGDVIPLASAAGISIDEVLGALAAMTKNGLATSKSITALKAVLSAIVDPTKEAQDAAAALGIDFSAAALAEKGLGGMLAEIQAGMEAAAPAYTEAAAEVAGLASEYERLQQVQQDADASTAALKSRNDELTKSMQAMSAEEKKGDSYTAMATERDANKTRISQLNSQKAQAKAAAAELKKEIKAAEGNLATLSSAADSQLAGFASLFGSIEALNAISVLTSKTGAQDYATSVKTMRSAGDSTQMDTAYGKVTDTTSQQLAKAKTQIQNTSIEVGETMLIELAPVIMEVLQGIRDLCTWFGSLSEEEQAGIVKALALVAALGPLLTVIGGIITAGGTLVAGIGGIVKAVGGASAAIGGAGGLAGIMGTLGGALTAAGGAIGGLLAAAAPFLPWIAAAVAAVVGIIAIIKNWDKIVQLFSNTWDRVTSTASTAWTAFTDAVGKKGQEILDWFTSMPEKLQKAIEGVVRAALGWGGDIIDGLLAGAQERLGWLLDGAQGVAGLIGGGIDTLLSGVDGIRTTLSLQPESDAAAATAAYGGEQSGMLGTLVGMLGQYLPDIAAQKDIVLDSGVLVGELAPGMDAELGTRQRRRARQ